MTSLDLADNAITDVSGRGFAEVLVNNMTLERLCLRGNDVSSKTAEILDYAMRNGHLKKL